MATHARPTDGQMVDEDGVEVDVDPTKEGSGFTIDRMWAFVATGEDGDEGIVATSELLPGVVLPMIASDKTRIEQLRPYAQKYATEAGLEIRLVRFEKVTEAEVIAP